jgi:molybdopterin synthase catalytic subunit
MRIKVKFFAAFREITGKREMDMDLPEGATVGDVLARLVQDFPRLADVAPSVRYVVDQEFVEENTPLHEGSEVVFVPPVAGGDERYEITEDVVTADELIAEVNNPTAGAVVTFVGVVRCETGGKPVRYLEYEAYKPMAEKKMAEIGAEIRQKWGLDHIVMRHRVGHLDVGDTAVIIAIASPHRKDGFDACQYAIDRLKQIVPIWKKEVYEDGEIWVGWQE